MCSGPTRLGMNRVQCHITLRQLEILLLVIEQSSFRKAAASLGLSPVAVGEHIRALEDRLRVSLFHRRRGGPPLLTPAGELAAERARAVIAAVNHLEADLLPLSTRPNWRIGLAPYVSRNLLGRVAELRKRYPDRSITTDICDREAEAITTMVANGVFDIAITITDCADGENLDGPVRKEIIIDEPLAVFVSQSHPLAGKRGVLAVDLADFPISTLSVAHPLRHVTDASLKTCGLGELRHAIETDDYSEILASVSHSRSFACMFAESGRADTIAHRLIMLDLAFALPAPQVVLLTNETAAFDRQLRLAAEYLANHYRSEAGTARRSKGSASRDNILGRLDPGAQRPAARLVQPPPSVSGNIC